MFEQLRGPEFEGVLFASQKFVKSKVEMTAFSVLVKGEEPPPSRAAKGLAREYVPWEEGRGKLPGVKCCSCLRSKTFSEAPPRRPLGGSQTVSNSLGMAWAQSGTGGTKS